MPGPGKLTAELRGRFPQPSGVAAQTMPFGSQLPTNQLAVASSAHVFGADVGVLRRE